MTEPPVGQTPYTHRVPVRIRDIDFAGHAHHSAALLYFEEARAAYWRDVVGEAADLADSFGFVLAEVTVRYKARVLYPDTLDVSVRVVLLGRKHFEMEYEARSSSGNVLVTGTSTQVMYDYVEGRSTSIPPAVRSALEGRDGPFDR